MAKFFLGVEINQTKGGISLSQVKFKIDMIQDVGLTEANTVATPFAVGNDLTITRKKMVEPN